MQKCGIFYENPTETGLAIKGLTWGLQNGACADSLADAHAATGFNNNNKEEKPVNVI